MYKQDTITAIATPVGAGAISIIRVSGDNAIQSVDQIFNGKTRLLEAKSHTIHYGKLCYENNIIDDVLVSVFKAPNSYTGEDSIEISYHGNPLIGENIIKVLLKLDIRLAEPGEFTKRAFLNNRMDLSQAEAVADVISSRAEASLKGARNQLDGLLSAKVKTLRDMLLNTCSFVEIELDFAEEQIEFINKPELNRRIEEILTEIETLLKTYNFGKIIRDGINVAITGEPNVGKSSLLNLLLKESRAIVSEIPGTTRDVIREEVSIDGILFRLYDTAGLRSSEDLIEKEGIARSLESAKNADLVILLCDINKPFPQEIYKDLLKSTPEQKIIKVLNKIDLEPESPLKQNYNAAISALNGKGIDELFQVMKDYSNTDSVYTESGAIVSNARHFTSLSKAKEFLITAKEAIGQGMSGEFISVDLRNAAHSLGEIIGEFTSDDVLNNIFMKFCIGK